MDLSDDQRHDLDVALNEATLLGAEVDAERRAAALTFSVLSLPPDDGPPPHDARVQFVLGPVGRLAASLRNGRWDGLYADDPRTAGHGIAPLAGNGRTGGQ